MNQFFFPSISKPYRPLSVPPLLTDEYGFTLRLVMFPSRHCLRSFVCLLALPLSFFLLLWNLFIPFITFLFSFFIEIYCFQPRFPFYAVRRSRFFVDFPPWWHVLFYFIQFAIYVRPSWTTHSHSFFHLLPVLHNVVVYDYHFHVVGNFSSLTISSHLLLF